jgi:APA family basic amino acid/polyamine antiporter
MQASVLVGPRIYHAMARDGLFPSRVASVSAKTGAPVVALVLQGVIALAELLTGRFDQLVRFTMFAIIAFSTLAVVAVFVLRVRMPDAPRPFRVPGYPFVPAVFVAVSGWMFWSVLTFSDVRLEALAGLAIVVTGVPAYAAFRYMGRRPQGPQESSR